LFQTNLLNGASVGQWRVEFLISHSRTSRRSRECGNPSCCGPRMDPRFRGGDDAGDFHSFGWSEGHDLGQQRGAISPSRGTDPSLVPLRL